MGKWRRKVSAPRRWQRNHLVSKYGAVCHLCGQPFAKARDITFDHWQPVSKGGMDDIENYRLAHSGCNSLKADMTPDEFLMFQRGEIAWDEAA